jgi:hypothetical protein
MKYNRFISTAVLFLLLGTTLPAFAQKGEEEKGGGGGKPQAAQHEQQPQHTEKAPPQQHAQKAQAQQHTEKAPPQQHAQKAQAQQHAEKAPPQQTRQSRGEQQQTVAYNGGNNGNRGGEGGGNYGRISNANYSAHFGHGHSFHMGRPRMIGGYNRFQYGGYWFGYNEGWPVGWNYSDDCYVEYIDGGYYMFDLRHPGFRLTLNIF